MAQLQLPPDEYTDLSPKGSVDEALVDVIDEVNAVEGFVTTSSCAGRASVFLEGSRVAPAAGSGESGTVAGVGGKGGGGTWLYVSHDPFAEVAEKVDWETAFGLVKDGSEPAHDRGSDDGEKRFIHFKFEPMILHVLTASLEHAQALLRCAQQAGFRESGVINVTAGAGEPDIIPIVAIRTMGLGFESLIGFQQNGKRQPMVETPYLETLVELSNTRFVENKKRIERFRVGFQNLISNRKLGGQKKPEGWEDAEARRARKRAEGLKRREELKAEGARNVEGQPDDTEGATSFLTDLELPREDA